MGWDEFMAGGRHPYHWGNGTVGNNVQFSGYEGASLTGETMLIANATYRFPLMRNMNLRAGPLYTESMYLQFFGTLGNLWSFRVEGDRHIEGYSVVPDRGTGGVRREVPFKDFASKNSPPGEPHYLLKDIGAELRIRSFIWNDFDWDSFVRVAYGFGARGRLRRRQRGLDSVLPRARCRDGARGKSRSRLYACTSASGRVVRC